MVKPFAAWADLTHKEYKFVISTRLSEPLPLITSALFRPGDSNDPSPLPSATEYIPRRPISHYQIQPPVMVEVPERYRARVGAADFGLFRF
jgi:hypothetical protein